MVFVFNLIWKMFRVRQLTRTVGLTLFSELVFYTDQQLLKCTPNN